MKYKPYPKYKPSGVAWLGDVPEHWEISTVRHQFENLDYRRVPLAGEIRASHEKTYAYYGASGIIDHVEDYLFNEPMILVAEDGANLLSRSTPLAFLATGEYWVNNHAHILRPRSGHFGYWVPILQIYDYTPLVTGAAQPKLTAERLHSIKLPTPPDFEQSAIASFLDVETGRLERLLGKQRELMERLGEKRRALISRCVTRGLPPPAAQAAGLHPHPKLKPTGIDWLGEIPEHWAIGVKLKSLSIREPAAFTNGPFGSDLLTSEIEDEGIPVIYIRDLKATGYKRASRSHVTEEKARELKKFRVTAGDVLIAKVGDPPGFGCVYPATEPPGIICQDVIRLRPDRELIDERYFCNLLNSNAGIAAVDNVSVELTRKRFSLDDLRSIRLPLPPKAEQTAIAAYLDTETAKLDGLISKVAEAIERLTEYRTALITAAVTGKIDVRKAPYGKSV